MKTSDKIRSIMTPNPITVNELTLLAKVALVFEKRTIHHIPVLDESGKCTGIISMNDFNMLQDKFTIFGLPEAEKDNARFQKSLIAKEVMTKNPFTVDVDDDIAKAIKMFMSNVYHALLVTENDVLVGIVTPYDILKNI